MCDFVGTREHGSAFNMLALHELSRTFRGIINLIIMAAAREDAISTADRSIHRGPQRSATRDDDCRRDTSFTGSAVRFGPHRRAQAKPPPADRRAQRWPDHDDGPRSMNVAAHSPPHA